MEIEEEKESEVYDENYENEGNPEDKEILENKEIQEEDDNTSENESELNFFLG